MKWRKWNRILHRDVGYLLFALTAIYSISGLAVNHIDDWNPSYSSTTTQIALGPLAGTDSDSLETEVVAKARLDQSEIVGRHRASEDEFILFLPHGGEVRIAISSGEGTIERIRPRPVLFESNVLHLNHLRGTWTLIADAFAICLFGLAVTGLFMLKGPVGLGGRGKWFVVAGFVVPILFIWYYYGSR